MSGTRLFNFREGDRSEYLATYFFSAIGLVSPVPRQEDIGFDLVCSVADQETGRLSFNHQFLVSVKSVSSPDVDLQPAKTEDGSFPHVEWLFRLDLPLLLAVVDKNNQSIRVYSTLPIWFLRVDGSKCGALTLRPRSEKDNLGDIGRPAKGAEIAGHTGFFHYTVDLGHPILCLSISDLPDRQKLNAAKKRLRMAVELGKLSAHYMNLGVPYFYWFARTKPNGEEPTPAFYAESAPLTPLQTPFPHMAPVLVCLGLRYKAEKNEPRLNAVRDLLGEFPAGTVPPEVSEALK